MERRKKVPAYKKNFSFAPGKRNNMKNVVSSIDQVLLKDANNTKTKAFILNPPRFLLIERGAISGEERRRGISFEQSYLPEIFREERNHK